jgi:hypothetical protein
MTRLPTHGRRPTKRQADTHLEHEHRTHNGKEETPTAEGE